MFCFVGGWILGLVFLFVCGLKERLVFWLLQTLFPTTRVRSCICMCDVIPLSLS